VLSKVEIDTFFTTHDKQIDVIISTNKHKCNLPNVESIKTDLYLICIEKKHIIKDLSLSWIKHLANTEYRWKNSQSNRINTIFANEHELSANIESDEYCEDEQNLEFALAKYLLQAKPSEKLFYDLYVNKGIRTVRGVAKYLNISHRSAWTIINDFKTKIKNYER
jgi:hypothetical protein